MARRPPSSPSSCYRRRLCPQHLVQEYDGDRGNGNRPSRAAHRFPDAVPAAPPAVLPQAPQAAPAAPVTITQPEQVVDARPNRQPAPAVQEHIPDAAPVAGPARHIVRTGDTWERIARDNQVAVNDLKAVNPRVQRLVSGSTLVIPARPGDKMAPEKTAAAETETDGVAHIVKKGETLSVIARKYKMNWRSLQKFNKMNDRDVARLKIGQKIMIPKK